MTDSNGEENTNLYYDLGEIKNNQFTATLICDQEWLDAENRSYPVTVDPVIFTEQTWTETNYQSAYISSYKATSCFGRGGAAYEGSLYAGYEYASSSGRREKVRSLIKFSLPSLKKGYRVVKAEMHTYFVDSGNDTTVNIKRVTGSWNQSSVTWNTQPSVSSLVSEYKVFNLSDSAGFKSWDITTLVNDWYMGTYTNNGIMMISPAENDGTHHRARFYSSGYSSDTKARPYLTISVRNMAGLEDYYSYTTFDAGTAGTAYVNNFTGNLVFIHTDISTSGMLMPVSVSGVYNTTSSGNLLAKYPRLGRGKKLSVQQTVRESSSYGLTGNSLSMYPYAYEDADGTVHYFYKTTENGTTTYIDEDGLNLNLKVKSNSYEITDKDGNKKVFNERGLLVSASDADGNTATFSYKTDTLNDGTAHQFLYLITDGAGHKITLEYEKSLGYLTKITGPDGKSISYTYTNELHTGITYADETKSSYSYNSNGMLTMVKAADGYRFDFTYSDDGTKGIETVTEKGGSTTGQYAKFSRSKPYQTIIRDSGKNRTYGDNDDIRTVYQFDTFGRATSVKTALGSGTLISTSSNNFTTGSKSGSTDIGKRNRIEAESATGKTSNNILVNHSFESDGSWTASHWLDDTYANSSSAGYSTAEAYNGSRSIKIKVDSATVTGGYTMYQHAMEKVQGGKTYTASVYVKTNSLTPKANSTISGAGLGIRIIKEDSSAERIYSDLLLDTSGATTENGWQRVEVSFTVPEGATNLRITPMIYCATGTAYFDCIQLEEGKAANNYNLLQNTDFENSSSGWTVKNGKSTDTVKTTEYNSGAKSFYLEGESAKTKYISQTVKISGSETDTYILSGFAKANAVPFSKSEKDKLFAIAVKIVYTDGTDTKKYPAYFNYAVNEWQNVSGAFTLSDGTDSIKTPESITVYCHYSNQANSCYFDDICLIKDPVPTYSYDSNGNLTSARENSKKKSTLTYDAKDNLTGVKDENNVNYTYTYGNSSNPHQITSAKDSFTGIKNNFEYFSNGTIKAVNVTHNDVSEIIRTSVAYSDAGSNISAGAYLYRYVDEHGRNTYYDYNKKSGLLNSVTDANGNVTDYEYNTNNGLVTSVNSNNSSVLYTYNTSNRRLESITHNGFKYGFTFDAFGNMLKTKAGGVTLVTNTYASGNGLLSESEYGNGDTVSYVYDSIGRVTGIKNNGTSKHTWTYSGSSIPVSYVDKTSDRKYRYTYDSLGRLIYQTGKNNSDSKNRTSSSYKYDISDNLTEITNTAGSASATAKYYYDDINRPTRSYFNGEAEHNYTYDKLGRLTNAAVTLTDTTVNHRFTYHSAAARNTGDSTQYQTTQVKTETIGGRAYNYTYDNVGNITAIKERKTSDGDYAVKVSYTYDDLGQITRENNKDLNKTRTYTYDSGGNIKTVKEYAYTTGTLGTATKTISYTYSSTWKDKLTKYGSQEITYDGMGNPLSYRNGMTFTWFGRQMKTAKVDGTTISYKYNADGLRTEKKVGSTVHSYEYTGNTLYYENRGGMELHYRYDVNGNLASVTRIKADGTKFTLYAICNSRGDVDELRTLAGEQYARYVYDTWGNTIHIYDADGDEITSTANLAVQNPIRYRGYYFDSETGLYYLQSRYYDPVTCRFVNADNQLSTGSDLTGMNLFAYCGNNPVNRIDPTGEAWYHWALGAAVVAGCAAATVITCGGFAAAASAVIMVANGMAAATTASTIAAGAFIGSTTVYGMAVLSAAGTSSSVEEFSDQGNWGTVAATVAGAVFNGTVAYTATRTPTTTIYRSVSSAEAQDIKNSGKFNLAPGGMESKQFGFNLSETRQFGKMMGQNTIVSAKVPNSMLNQLYTGGVDTSIFRAGTLTVYGDQLEAFNQAVNGTIKFMP